MKGVRLRGPDIGSEGDNENQKERELGKFGELRGEVVKFLE